MANVYQFQVVRLVSGEDIADDISKPDPRGVIPCTLRVVVDEDGKIVEVREGQTGYVQGAEVRAI